MTPSERAQVQCPYCGEMVEIAIDSSVARQEYVEDCQVCCKPMALRIRIGADGEPQVDARGEDESV